MYQKIIATPAMLAEPRLRENLERLASLANRTCASCAKLP
jgi:hypothetical protein